MIVAGDWAITPGVKALANGAVSLHGSRIRAVGTRDELLRRFPDSVVRDHPGCIIMPGLVNAHTHLALTALQGAVPPDGDFAGWINGVTRAIFALDRDDFATSAAAGSLDCLLGGVTVVCDIGYGPESPAAAGDSGLAGVFCWEVLGITPAELPETLARIEYPVRPADQCPPRTRCGLSPHSPHTSGPDLLRAVKRVADALEVPFVIHAAESVAELQLLTTGDGPFAEKAARLAHGFHPPRMGAIRYLDRLGVLEGSIIVHAAHLMPGEAELLAQKARGVILCPRSNALLGNGKPPVRKLITAGAKIALGTDSAASNDDLDMFNEARALRAIDPALNARTLVRMMTEDAASMLGLGDRFGRLAPHYNADVIAVEIGDTGHPIEMLLERGSRANVKTVFSAGVARVIGGVPASPDTDLRKATARVTAKAARAVGV